MNQNSEMNDDLRPEYDFSQMPIVYDRPWVIVVEVQTEPDCAPIV